MTLKTCVRAPPEPAHPPSPEPHPVDNDAEQPAGNRSQPLELPPVRTKAHADQTTIQEKGADALPVSDYPLKRGPSAANALDLQEQSRPNVKNG